MFYVYEWFIVDTGEIFYVGKGTRKRYKVRKHNALFNNMIRTHKCDSRIIKEFELEEDAFAYEYKRINELKLLNQCSCNIREGGTGGTIEWWTDELRDKYSKNNVMKADYQRKRMSKNNPMKDKETALKVNSKNKKAVYIGDKKYSSIKDAVKAYDVSGSDVIKNWCLKGINPYGEKCHYENCEQTDFQGGRYNKGGCKSLTYKNKHYEAAIDLSKSLGMSNSAVLSWLKKGFDNQGNICRYDDDNRDLVFSSNKYSKKSIIIDGIHYSSIVEAANKLGVCRGTIENALKGKHKSRFKQCEYDNQQPSQGNTDNSTLEGSETNG